MRSTLGLAFILMLLGCRHSGGSTKPSEPVPNNEVCKETPCVPTTLPPPCVGTECASSQDYGFFGSLRHGSEEAPRTTTVVDDRSLTYFSEFFDVAYLKLPPDTSDPVLKAENTPDSAWECSFQTQLKKADKDVKLFVIRAHIKPVRVSSHGVCRATTTVDGKDYALDMRRPLNAKAFDFESHSLSRELLLFLPIKLAFETGVDLGVSGRDAAFLDNPSFDAVIPGCELTATSEIKEYGMHRLSLKGLCEDGDKERTLTITPRLKGSPADLNLPAITGKVKLQSTSCQNRNGPFYYALSSSQFKEFYYENQLICQDDIDKDRIFKTTSFDVLPLRNTQVALVLPRVYQMSMKNAYTGVEGFLRVNPFPSSISNVKDEAFQVANQQILLFAPQLPFQYHLPRNFKFIGLEFFRYCNSACSQTAYGFELGGFITTDNAAVITSFFCGYYDKAQARHLPILTFSSTNTLFNVQTVQDITMASLLSSDQTTFTWKKIDGTTMSIKLSECP